VVRDRDVWFSVRDETKIKAFTHFHETETFEIASRDRDHGVRIFYSYTMTETIHPCFWRSPSWISYFRLRRTTFPVVPLNTSKTFIYNLEFSFYVVYKLRNMCLSSSSILESAILNVYFHRGLTYYSPLSTRQTSKTAVTTPSGLNVVESDVSSEGWFNNRSLDTDPMYTLNNVTRWR